MDDEYDIEDEIEEPEQERRDNPNLKKLREKARKADQAEAELAALKRERAFEKAGVDTDHPLAKTLLPAYTGDLDPEAVKAWLESVGASAVFKSAPAPQTPTQTTPTNTPEAQVTKPEISPEELLATQERQALASGAESAGAVAGENPFEKGLDRFVQAMANGQSREDASGAFFEEVFAAAGAGDQRVIYTDPIDNR